MDGNKGHKLSQSWKRIAKKQQEGFTTARPPGIGAEYAGKAKDIGKGSKIIKQKLLFLRKDRKTFTVPARPLLAPFWGTYRGPASRQIVDLFNNKLAGNNIYKGTGLDF